jgi:bifunctional DNA-binding transcriptional regulator/antitoxin component of YhaV-PrlF toxin-antitoxin module
MTAGDKRVQKVLAGLRITLPADWCKKWDVKEGDVVILDEDDDGSMVIKAANVVPRL